MSNNLMASLKLIYKPLIMYYGEWEFLRGLKNIALEKRKKNLYSEFIDRYYYKPLMVIFKDEDIVKSFQFAICSRVGNKGRELFFSKKLFLSNIIDNVDEVYGNGSTVFQDIKKTIREKKDKFRDVDNYGKESKFYKEVMKEYKHYNVDMTFEKFVSFCRKKYTRLLTGYNAVLDFFDRPINLDKFISCFDPHKLYLHTAYSVLEHCKYYYDCFGRLDFNASILDSYKIFVNDIRKEDEFYNTYIIRDNVVYTTDDLLKDYAQLSLVVNGK